MLGLIPRILAVTVAIAIGGNSGFCACGQHRQPKPIAQASAEPHGCPKCGHAQPKPPTTQPQKQSPAQPCPNCQNTDKPDRAIEKAPTHEMTIAPIALPAPVAMILPAAPSHIVLDRFDTSPPIHLDLFHSFTLLTI